MKTIGLEHATLDGCIKNARRERIVLTRRGKPVALLVGITGLDEEQLQLASSRKFWTLIEERRKQKTISRAELERRIGTLSESTKKPTEKMRAKAKRSAA
jgi:antitoxin (DNA-binding transcriptional repressor) of toxin-antitoxin stability system